MSHQLLPYPSNERYSMWERANAQNNKVYRSSYVEHQLKSILANM